MSKLKKQVILLLLISIIFQMFTPFFSIIGYAEGEEMEYFSESTIENIQKTEDDEKVKSEKSLSIEEIEKENNEEVIESFTEESSVKNRTEGNELDVTYSDLKISTKKLDNREEEFSISIDWRLTDENQTVKPGDYFYLDWPDNVKFPAETTISQIKLSGYGRAERVGNSNIIKFIFNDSVDTEKTNVEGDLAFNGVQLSRNVTGEGSTNVDINLDRESDTIEVNFPEHDGTYDSDASLGRDLGKWGNISDDGNKIEWRVDFNGEKVQGKYTFTDSFGPGHYLDKESVRLSYMNANGNYLISEGKVLGDNQSIEVNGSRNTNIEYTEENGKITGFTITGYAFPEDGAYLLYYSTILEDNIQDNKVSNEAKYTLENKEEVSQNVEVSLASAWGTARGKEAEVGEVKLIKIDYPDKDKNIDSKDLEVLSGVEFKLEDEDGNKTKNGQTNEAGILSFTGLDPGKYKIKEVEFPEGYEKTLYVKDSDGKIKEVKNGYKFELKANEGITILAYNKKVEEPTTEVKIKKVDSEEKEKILSGAKFGLYKKELPEEIGDEEPIEEDFLTRVRNFITNDESLEGYALVEEFTTVEEVSIIESLEDGEYKLVELESPEGYEKIEEEIYFEIVNGKIKLTDENKGVSLENDNEIVVENTKEEEPVKPTKPTEPTDPDNPKPVEPETPEKPEKPEKPIEPEEPTKPIELEEPEEEVEEEIKDDIIIEEPEEEVEEEIKDDIIIEESEEEVEEEIKYDEVIEESEEEVEEEIKDDIIIEEEKHLPKTGDGLNSRVYGLITLALGSLLLLLGVRSKEDEK